MNAGPADGEVAAPPWPTDTPEMAIKTATQRLAYVFSLPQLGTIALRLWPLPTRSLHALLWGDSRNLYRLVGARRLAFNFDEGDARSARRDGEESRRIHVRC